MAAVRLDVERLNGYTDRRFLDEGATAESVIREVLYYLQLATEARNISITTQEFDRYLEQLEQRLRETFQSDGIVSEIRQMDERYPDGAVMNTYNVIKHSFRLTEKN